VNLSSEPAFVLEKEALFLPHDATAKRASCNCQVFTLNWPNIRIECAVDDLISFMK